MTPPLDFFNTILKTIYDGKRESSKNLKERMHAYNLQLEAGRTPNYYILNVCSNAITNAIQESECEVLIH